MILLRNLTKGLLMSTQDNRKQKMQRNWSSCCRK